ncbi:putative RNA-binding Zn ribbon-like protein [Pseudonocardia kunmingensis]|uniref:Putative RNA-binding Zn ribbon-like protein n=1 Tax=Pseudonocardia kunmingensis TaxID=630975 RepID=A0A543DAJ0_9PSEU|nr:putative RNA-binding Zn ribbon-like protein [Pseudonocardia kunmingensis]
MWRPLLGEPLGLDLLNTCWVDRGQAFELLVDLAGLRQWLEQAGLAPSEHPVTQGALRAVRHARGAVQAHLDDPASEEACAVLNDVLRWGHTWPQMTPDGPRSGFRVDDPERRAAWLAAANYAELLVRDRERIRQCAHAECVLYFLDTSPKGNRRWCSMALCGNRAKAARHYARVRPPTRRH